MVAFFSKYLEQIESSLKKEIEKLGERSALREAVEYALTNGGKRFRPMLVHMVAKALGYEVDVSFAALSVEYSHTASLIADDLPCMDDDDMRRNKPSLHKVFGESTALLASYALLSAGYESLATNAKLLAETRHPYRDQADTICRLALENVSYNAGFSRLIVGQFLDLFPPDTSEKILRDVIIKKTVSLFEVSFVLGWLYGGGDLEKLDLIKEIAEHFGVAFQVADDFGDVEQDACNERSINAVAILGLDAATAMFYQEIVLYRQKVALLDWNDDELLSLAELLEQQFLNYKATLHPTTK